ncbi:hypothetical protein Goari_006332 [Gossypium aridum]|uniref:CGL160/ATPI domain-containing protein n=1 Tax=Gossypium aridum TaxID=34290 RepID=A0A7J8XMN2_GOSAI|nr:hypothetical protein [Gossypium aridum]
MLYNSVHMAWCKQEEPSGFLSLNRVMSLDSLEVDLSKELATPSKPLLQQAVETSTQSSDSMSRKWKLVPTRREQEKWDKATKASTGGSGVMLRELQQPQGDPEVLAAQSREQYYKLKKKMQVLTLVIGGFGLVSAYVSYSPEVAARFLSAISSRVNLLIKGLEEPILSLFPVGSVVCPLPLAMLLVVGMIELLQCFGKLASLGWFKTTVWKRPFVYHSTWLPKSLCHPQLKAPIQSCYEPWAHRSSSFGAGLLGSLVYIRMLGSSVDSLAEGAKGVMKYSLAKTLNLLNSLSVGKIGEGAGDEIKVLCMGAVAQPRLLVPVVLVMIYNRWNGILVPEYGYMQLELIPMLVGFFTYKIATFFQAIDDAVNVVGGKREV